MKEQSSELEDGGKDVNYKLRKMLCDIADLYQFSQPQSTSLKIVYMSQYLRPCQCDNIHRMTF